MRHYPAWLKKPFSPDGTARAVDGLIQDLRLTTVCRSAVCPNLRECWSMRQLTFMILGKRCTRLCRFCAIDHAKPQTVEMDEPARVAEAVRRLELEHVVITSVARDDLADEGAGHFVEVICAVRAENPAVTVETLVPDFHARPELIRRVAQDGGPEIFAHNIETVRRLSPYVRPQADYDRSLATLRLAADAASGGRIKSSLMVGMGEKPGEVEQTLAELRTSGVTHLTMGQYLRPDACSLPVLEYVSPQRFAHYRNRALEAGFVWVKAGPFVRSSYHAVDALREESQESKVA